jgi:hypothetical protein
VTDPDLPSPSGFSAVVLAAAVAGGVLLGGAVGFASHAAFTEPEVVVPPPEVIEKQITDEDLARLCETLTADEKTKVVAAQERVVQLETDLQQREAALAEYKAKEIKDEKQREAAARKWKEMEAEISRLKGELQQAQTERDTLRTELKQTLQDLDRQIAQTEKYKEKAKVYKEQSTGNAWSAFQAQAKVEICDRGTRKRHEKCHEAVEAAVAPYADRWKTCVDSYQAVPTLRQLGKGDSLPQFSERLPDDNKFTRSGWAIVFCDPTLPEAGSEDDL